MTTKTAQECENLSAANVRSLVAAWGDSLTNGTGSTGGSTYPAQAAALFAPDRAVANKGVSGETSTQIKTRMVADAVLRPRTAWIWAGRNNYTSPATVKADIAAMVASLGHDRYLVGSIINGEYTGEYSGASNYNTMMQLNADLAALYGLRFVDVRTPLVAEGAPGGSAENATDYGRDIVPSGLRSDNIHLLNAGYAIVASAFKAANDAMGW